jgi:hypothetical protein
MWENACGKFPTIRRLRVSNSSASSPRSLRRPNKLRITPVRRLGVRAGQDYRGGYALAAVLKLVAAGAELKFGIDAERRSLESIAEPLSTA